jgi:hypothetical protein
MASRDRPDREEARFAVRAGARRFRQVIPGEQLRRANEIETMLRDVRSLPSHLRHKPLEYLGFLAGR